MAKSIWILAALLFVAVAGAQSHDGPRERAQLEKRWSRKTADEREVLRQRFERFSRMDPEARRELMARARKLRGVEDGLREDPPLKFRKELEVLDPQGRERHWREGARERYRQSGRDLRHKLPPRFLAKLEAAKPEERREMLAKFRLEQISMKGRVMFDYLARELELPPEKGQLDVYQAMSRQEKLQILRRMRRAHIEMTAASGETPPGFTPERWERMRSFSDREFFECLMSGDLPRLDRQRRRPLDRKRGSGPEAGRGHSRRRRP